METKFPKLPTNVVTVGMAGIILMASGGMGGAYAAKAMITGADIKNGSITAKDLAKNSVKAQELSRNSVGSDALAPNSVTTNNLTGEAGEVVEVVSDATTETSGGEVVLGAGRLVYNWTGDPSTGATPPVLENFNQAVFTYSVTAATKPGTYTIIFGGSSDQLTAGNHITCSIPEASVELPGSCTATAAISGGTTSVSTAVNHPGGSQATLVGIQVGNVSGIN